MSLEIFFQLENARESWRNILRCVCKGLLITVSEGQQFLSGVVLGDRENFGRPKIYDAQGFFSIAQGERIYVKNEGENLKNNEHSSTR